MLHCAFLQCGFDPFDVLFRCVNQADVANQLQGGSGCLDALGGYETDGRRGHGGRSGC